MHTPVGSEFVLESEMVGWNECEGMSICEPCFQIPDETLLPNFDVFCCSPGLRSAHTPMKNEALLCLSGWELNLRTEDFRI